MRQYRKCSLLWLVAVAEVALSARVFAPASPGAYIWQQEVNRTARLATQTSSGRQGAFEPGASPRADTMKRVAIWAFYAVGALAMGYLALYAYAVFTGRDLQPGKPIHIFRKPDAPEYS